MDGRSQLAAEQVRLGSRPPRRLWPAVVAGALALLVVGSGAYWLLAVRPPGYVQSTAPATLEWQCWNAIFWVDPATNVKWWAGPQREMTGTIVTARDSPVITSTSVKHATGSMHFDTAERATFTSDAGGTLVFNRQTGAEAYTLDCQGGPGD